MIRTVFFIAALGTLASCTQYQEPQANCFTFLTAVAPVDPDCTFTPIGAPGGEVET